MTVASIAQGLCLLGHTVLVIDADPACHLTKFMGFNPDLVSENDTLLAIVGDNPASRISHLIKSTYFFSCNLIPSHQNISKSYLDFQNLSRESFFNILKDSINNDVIEIYDVILIDISGFDIWALNAINISDILCFYSASEIDGFLKSSIYFETMVNIFSKLNWLNAKKSWSNINFINCLHTNNVQASTSYKTSMNKCYGSLVTTIDLSFDEKLINWYKTIYDVGDLDKFSKTNFISQQEWKTCLSIFEEQLFKIWYWSGQEKFVSSLMDEDIQSGYGE